MVMKLKSGSVYLVAILAGGVMFGTGCRKKKPAQVSKVPAGTSDSASEDGDWSSDKSSSDGDWYSSASKASESEWSSQNGGGTQDAYAQAQGGGNAQGGYGDYSGQGGAGAAAPDGYGAAYGSGGAGAYGGAPAAGAGGAGSYGAGAYGSAGGGYGAGAGAAADPYGSASWGEGKTPKSEPGYGVSDSDVAALGGGTPSYDSYASSSSAYGDTGSAASEGGSEVYVVKRGDTLSRIAKLYRTSIRNIMSLNGMTTKEQANRIRVGMKLKVPAGR